MSELIANFLVNEAHQIAEQASMVFEGDGKIFCARCGAELRSEPWRVRGTSTLVVTAAHDCNLPQKTSTNKIKHVALTWNATTEVSCG